MVNLVYQNAGTPLVWKNTGGDAVITLTSLASAAGRNGELYDFGVAAIAREYAWRAWVKFATIPVVDDEIEIYWKTSDGTSPDNDDGVGDIALSNANKLSNLQYMGSIIVDEAATAPVFTASGFIEVLHQHGAPVFFNNTADALSATAGDHGFSITPIPLEIQ